MNQRKAAEKYIRRIRKAEKKKYAINYLKWKLNGEQGEMESPQTLGFMTKQAVRMEIDSILDTVNETRKPKPE